MKLCHFVLYFFSLRKLISIFLRQDHSINDDEESGRIRICIRFLFHYSILRGLRKIKSDLYERITLNICANIVVLAGCYKTIKHHVYTSIIYIYKCIIFHFEKSPADFPLKFEIRFMVLINQSLVYTWKYIHIYIYICYKSYWYTVGCRYQYHMQY